MQNKEIYNSIKVVKEYRKNDYLPKPEQEIFNFINKSSLKINMLDIGVGTGRTTKYFAPVFENYFGIDNAELMIEACKMNYADFSYHFKVVDARALNVFEEGFFDFVLFSFNGIDCVSISERIMVINEIFRVLKKNGVFAFSIHNVYNIPKLFSYQWPRNPFKLIKEIRRKLGVNKLNRSIAELMSNDFVDVIDGDLEFSTSYVYSKPSAQIKQLENAGFYIEKILSMKGQTIDRNKKEWSEVSDPWLYYICKK